MKWIALIDATHHTDQAPPGRIVAGLTLLERAVRLAAVSDCSHAVIAAGEDYADEIAALAADIDFGIEVLVRPVEATAPVAVMRESSEAIEPFLDSIDGVLYVRSSTVYDRGLIHAWHDDNAGRDFAYTARTEGGELADVLEVGAERFFELVGDGEQPEDLQAECASTDKWQVRVTDEASAKDAAHRLWMGCRKPIDGIISRHLNRYISLSISRTIAATRIKPNHISIVTFSLGIIAAIFAGIGGYKWFVLAGLAYQLNSIVDGVDGELARVRYEFSLLGEWLDTLSDDNKDVLFYGGLAIGAWRTWAFPFAGLDSSVWLWLGAIAVCGKIVSMIAYYSWLIAHKRGDLLAFEWSFEDDDKEPSALSTLLSNFKYLTKNDFIVFFAMLLAFVHALPYFLFVVAPGQFIIASSVIVQRMTKK